MRKLSLNPGLSFLPPWLLTFTSWLRLRHFHCLSGAKNIHISNTDFLRPTPLCLMDWILNPHLGPRTTSLPILPAFTTLHLHVWNACPSLGHHGILESHSVMSVLPTVTTDSLFFSFFSFFFFSSLAVIWLNKRSPLIHAAMAARLLVMNFKLQSQETHKKETPYIKLLNLKPAKMYL